MARERGLSRKTSAIVALLVIAFAGAVLFSYSNGQPGIQRTSPTIPPTYTATLLPPTSTIVSSSQQGTSSSTSKTTGAITSTAIPAETLLADYLQNEASADAAYTGRTVQVSGSVGNVEKDSTGNYKSCVYEGGGTVLVVGCQSPDLGYSPYVIWFWQNQDVASQVPVNGAYFVAQCTVAGLRNGELVLNSCALVSVSQNASGTFCNNLWNGVSIENERALLYFTNRYLPSGQLVPSESINLTLTIYNGHNNLTLALAAVDPFAADLNQFVSPNYAKNFTFVQNDTTNSNGAGLGPLTIVIGKGMGSGYTGSCSTTVPLNLGNALADVSCPSGFVTDVSATYSLGSNNLTMSFTVDNSMTQTVRILQEEGAGGWTSPYTGIKAMSSQTFRTSEIGAFDVTQVPLTLYFGDLDFTGLCSFRAEVPVTTTS